MYSDSTTWKSALFSLFLLHNVKFKGVLSQNFYNSCATYIAYD